MSLSNISHRRGQPEVITFDRFACATSFRTARAKASQTSPGACASQNHLSAARSAAHESSLVYSEAKPRKFRSPAFVMTLLETVRDLVGGKTRSATIPLERAIVGDEIRAQVAGVAQAGGYSVPTQRLELASALRPASIAARLGPKFTSFKATL